MNLTTANPGRTGIRHFVLAMAIVILFPGCSRGPSPQRQLLHDVGRFAILPLHGRFLKSATVLQEQTVAFCEQPVSDRYLQLQALWKSSMYDWAALQTVKFGPVTVDNQGWKIQFWPDKHNLIQSRMQALLDGGDDITLERIDRAGAPMQGLSAMEFLIFDERGGALARYDGRRFDDAKRRCRALEAIAEHTRGVAAHLLQAWDPSGNDYLETFKAPGPDNADFAADDDAIVAILDSILATLEITKDRKLADPMGRNNKGGYPKPYASEAWRSRYSLPLIAAAIEGASTLYYAGERDAATPHLGIDDYLRESGAGALADRVDRNFRAAAAAVPQNIVLFDAVGEPGRTDALETLYQAMSALTQSVRNDIPAALDVTLGFNANDGD